MSGFGKKPPGPVQAGRIGGGGGGQQGFGQRSQPQGGGYGGGGADGGGDRDRRLEELLKPPAQPVRYFEGNDAKAPATRLLADEAEQVAKKLAKLPANQIRRFYGEVMALKRRAELTAMGDAEIVAQLMLLRAKAAYTWGRQKDYPEELVAFFNRHAHSVKTKQDFLRGFQPHFEAVMAFHKLFEEKKGNSA
jgi:CRISPR-associated protein Csm2